MDKLHRFPAKETDPEERNDLEGARKVTVGLRKNWITGHFLFLLKSNFLAKNTRGREGHGHDTASLEPTRTSLS